MPLNNLISKRPLQGNIHALRGDTNQKKGCIPNSLLFLIIKNLRAFLILEFHPSKVFTVPQGRFIRGNFQYFVDGCSLNFRTLSVPI